MLSIGQVVYSKCGRDKARPFIVLSLVDEQYVYIVDGSLRKLSRPKKKKRKHIQATKTISLEIQQKMLDESQLLDADVRNALEPYER